mgnify:CR=1 FL=1
MFLDASKIYQNVSNCIKLYQKWVWWVASGSSQAIGHTYTNPWYDRNICVSALERAHSLGHILVL